MRNTSTGWTTGFGGAVNKTTNGGRTWTSYSTASFNWMFSIDFLGSSDTGFVCGRLGTVQRTNNGGVNWSLQIPGTSQHLNEIVVKKDLGDTNEIVWCVGNGGAFLKSVSGGTVWSVATISSFDINCIFVFDEFRAILAGTGGNIMKTTDGGANFSAETSGTSQDIKSIYFLNDVTGYICGGAGMIRKSTDGGTSWFALSSGTSANLNSIKFEDENNENGFAVGDEGVILSTTDFGDTWASEASGSSTPLNSVFALSNTFDPDGAIVCAVGSYSKFMKRTTPVALPVELISFSHGVVGNCVELVWTTAIELNNRGFEVERRSGDKWLKVGFKVGAGNSHVPVYYSFKDAGLVQGIYYYRLRQIDYNGTEDIYNLNTSVEIDSDAGFEVFQNYPNPFNPFTNVRFRLSKTGFTSVRLYDVTGREVSILTEGIFEAGTHNVRIDGSDLASGTYYCIVESAGFRKSLKLTLLK